MVNANGERFADEGEDVWGYIYAKMGARIRTQPRQVAWQVYDAKVQSLLHADYRLPNACRVSADSLEELATQMIGMNPQGFLATVADFNQRGPDGNAVRPPPQGRPADAGSGHRQVELGPGAGYAAVRGVWRDVRHHVYVRRRARRRAADACSTWTDAPIPGLYAAGDMVGGLFYGNYPGGAGLASAAVFGRLAGTAAATDVR